MDNKATQDMISNLRLTAKIAPSSTDGFTHLNDNCREMMKEASALIAEQQAQIEALRWSLDRAVNGPWNHEVDMSKARAPLSQTGEQS